MSPSVTDIQVENLVFPATVKPPGTCHTFFLAGAGVRGMEIQGKFIKFTAIGVYLEDSAIPSLATKWKGKTAEELTGCVPFFNDIVTGPFGKFTRVTTILPLTGKQYSEKVAENCVAHWKAIGSYTDEEAKAIDKFLEVFKDEDFPPGSSILFTQSSAGSLTIGFSKDSSIPEDGKAVIDNKQLAEAVLDSIIGEQGVSPAAKHSLAVRVSGVLKHLDHEVIGNGKALHFISTMSPSVTDIQVENHVFPATVKPPGTCRTFFLAGAGVRGMEIQGKFIKFTAIGVYLEESAIPSLALKWKGKTADELTGSVPFFNDIVTGPFDKFTHVTTILPLTGKQYSEKVAENCVAHWKAIGSYTDEEAKAIDKFLEVFKDENFPPGSSILFTQSSAGSLTIGFSKDSSIPEDGKAVIDNKQLAEAVLDSIIGEHGVSPAAKHSLAVRVSDVLKHLDHEVIGNGKAEVKKMVSNATEIETQVAGVDRNGNGTTE